MASLFAFPLSHGEYTIKLSFGGEVYEYRYAVMDKTLPDPQDYFFDVKYWHHPYNSAEYYGVEPFGEEHLRILKEHQLLYKALGGKYMIAREKTDTQNGTLEKRIIPAGTYAAFKTKPGGLAWNELPALNDLIFESWLPSSEYKHKGDLIVEVEHL